MNKSIIKIILVTLAIVLFLVIFGKKSEGVEITKRYTIVEKYLTDSFGGCEIWFVLEDKDGDLTYGRFSPIRKYILFRVGERVVYIKDFFNGDRLEKVE